MNVENTSFKKLVEPDTDLKNIIVEYVGEKLQPKNDEVTLEMVVECMASEFKELLLLLGEENWIRGYHQAMEDVVEGEKLIQEEAKKLENES